MPALTRFYSAAGCRTQQELADFLGIRQSCVSSVKRRQAIPAAWLLTLLRQKGVNPDWVLSGRGAPFLAPAKDCGEPSGQSDLAKNAQTSAFKGLSAYTTQDLIDEIVRRSLESGLLQNHFATL